MVCWRSKSNRVGRYIGGGTATGSSRTTITNAMKELNEIIEGKDVETLKVRRFGGGRKRLTDKDPTLVEDLEMLLEPVTCGDSQSPLRWTCKSTRKLAEELKKQGHEIGDRKVAKLLHDLGYSLQSNRKTVVYQYTIVYYNGQFL